MNLERINSVSIISDEELKNVSGGKIFEWTAKNNEQKITYTLATCSFLAIAGGIAYKVVKFAYNKLKSK